MKSPASSYIHREQGVQHILETLKLHQGKKDPVVFLIHGQPLIGKTLLAKRTGEGYISKKLGKSVFWDVAAWTDVDKLPPGISAESAKSFRKEQKKHKETGTPLVILDHLEHSTVLREIIERSTGCRIVFLVTARNPHTALKELIPEANRMCLPSFADEEARVLLRGLLPAAHEYPDRAFAQLNEMVGGNPAVLNTMGHYLAAHPELTPAQMLAGLPQEEKRWLFARPLQYQEKRSRSMPVTLQEAYAAGVEGLSALAQQVLTHIAFFSPQKPLDARLLVDVFEQEYSRTKLAGAFRELAALGLVTPVEDLFFLPTLTADYGRQRAGEERKTIVRRIVKALLTEVGEVDETGFQKRFDSLAAHVLCIADYADLFGLHEELRWQLWQRLAAYQHTAQDWAGKQRSLEQQLAIVDARLDTPENQQRRMDLLAAMAEAYQQLDKPDELRRTLDDLERLCAQLEPPQSLWMRSTTADELVLFAARKRRWVGEKRLALQEYALADVQYQHARRILQRSGQKGIDVIETAQGQAQAFTQQEQPAVLAREAFVTLEKVIAESPFAVLTPAQAAAKMEICLRQGMEMEQTGNLRRARRYYEEAYDVLEPSVAHTAAPFRRAAWALGLLAVQRSRWQEARRHFGVLREHASGEEQVDAAAGLGLCLLAGKDYHGAQVTCAAALKDEQARMLPDHNALGLLTAILGSSLLLQGDRAQAEPSLQAAAEYFGNDEDQALVRGWLETPGKARRSEIAVALAGRFLAKVGGSYR